MTTKTTLYLPDKRFGFKPATYSDIRQHPEYGIEIIEKTTEDKWGWEQVKRTLNPKHLKMPNLYKDTQKTKVYRAEWTIKGEINGREFNDLDQMRDFKSDTWSALKVEIKEPGLDYHRHAKTCTAYHSGWIGMSREDWAANRITILHEIAHFLCPKTEHHGPMFARTLIDLCVKFISPEVGSVLLGNYMDGTERKRWKYDYKYDDQGRYLNTGAKIVKTQTTRPEVGGPRLGLARLGMQTGFSTGVPHTKLVSPIVARQIGMEI